MTRRTECVGRHRTPSPRGPVLWAGVATALQLWAAVPLLIELCSGGTCRLLLALPAVIITLMDAWHEFRTPPSVAHDSSISANHDGERGIG